MAEVARESQEFPGPQPRDARSTHIGAGLKNSSQSAASRNMA